MKTFVASLFLILGLLAYGAFKTPDEASDEVIAESVVVQQEHVIPKVEDIQIGVLWEEVNDYRESNGLRKLRLDPKLVDSSSDKCQDMVKKDYWSHDAPDGETPSSFIENRGYNYSSAGENLAYGYDDAKEVIAGWISSESHNENLLMAHYTDVGYSVCFAKSFDSEENQLVVVQHLAN